MKIKLSEEYQTEVFINANNAVSIAQHDNFSEEQQLIVFGSKKRAFEVAKAIMACARSASFEIDKEVIE
jgi:hypothetical protein